MKKVLFLISILIILLSSCRNEPATQYVYESPEQLQDGIIAGTLLDVGIDVTSIQSAVYKIQNKKYKEVHSLLIFKDNRLVFEEYFNGHQYQWDGPNHHGDLIQWDQTKLHHIMSDTKSFTSACIGIAIDKGFIQSVDQSIFDFLPKYQHHNTGGKDQITIEHLLTMTSGLEGNEWTAPYSSAKNPIIALWFPPCDDPIACILEKPMIHPPGTNFTYFGGNHIVLGEIIRNATKMDLNSFSRKYLFEPLGIDTSDWAVRFPNGLIEAAGGLKITPRAMVKFGVTFLNQGAWNGEQIISEKWIEKCSTDYPGNHSIKVPGESSGRRGYTYSWWTKKVKVADKEVNIYCAGGWGGQNIIVIPEYHTVIVFTGGNYTRTPPQWKILKKYVLPALV